MRRPVDVPRRSRYTSDVIRFFTTGSTLPPPLPALAWPMHGAAMDPALEKPENAGFSRGDSAVLVGGEPLLDGALLQWLQALGDAGAARVQAWTDGRLLARRDVVPRLREAGLSHVGVVLCGAEAAAHDFVVGVPGHFDAALRGLRAARKQGLRTSVVAPILRPTFRDLPLLVQRAMAIGVSTFWLVALPGPDRAKHGLLPHLAIAAPHARRAIKVARAGGRSAATCWVPPCLLEDEADAALDMGLTAPYIASHFGLQRASACEGCRLQPSCGGPLASYLDQHGPAGLQAVVDGKGR